MHKNGRSRCPALRCLPCPQTGHHGISGDACGYRQDPHSQLFKAKVNRVQYGSHAMAAHLREACSGPLHPQNAQLLLAGLREQLLSGLEERMAPSGAGAGSPRHCLPTGQKMVPLLGVEHSAQPGTGAGLCQASCLAREGRVDIRKGARECKAGNY